MEITLANAPAVPEAPVKAKPVVDLDALLKLHPQWLDESYIYVHCHFNNQWKDMLIRVWQSTFLVDRNSSSRAALVHAENISIAPQWTLIPDNREYVFLLIFEVVAKEL